MRFHLPHPLHSKAIRFHRRYLVAQIPVHNVSNYRANLSPPCQLNSSVHLVHKTSFLNEKIQKFFCQEFLHNNNKRCYLLRDDVVVTKKQYLVPRNGLNMNLQPSGRGTFSPDDWIKSDSNPVILIKQFTVNFKEKTMTKKKRPKDKF